MNRASPDPTAVRCGQARAAHRIEPVIEVSDLTKRYGHTTAVNRLTFVVQPGTVTGFLGPNGAGKSTTMRMILGLARPDGGYAKIGGRAYSRLREPLKHVGALLESASPHKALRGVNHLLWVAKSNRIGPRRVTEVLETLGLADAGEQRVGTYSLGMGQRLGLAMALLGDPPVLILDEPVNGLDPEGIRWFRQFTRGLAAEGRTVFVSSHLMTEMAMTADHLIVIAKGQLLADTSMADFVRRNARTYVRVRTGEPDRLGKELRAAGMAVTTAADGAMEVTDATPADISRVAAASGLTLDELSAQSASLEEAFLALTNTARGQHDAG
jgi:ABC-2 type transport system ATP-binding protein